MHTVNSLEEDLARARELSVPDIADAIESIGFKCTRCGACCTASTCEEESAGTEPHTATVFPDEIRHLQESTGTEWRDVARPMPYGLDEEGDVQTGTTFEWALQTDACGDCQFYDAGDEDGNQAPGDGGPSQGTCTVYGHRPLICRTYPFSVALGGTTQPMGEAVDREGIVRAHECEGLGRDISREDARELAETLKTRAIRELEEAIAVREAYDGDVDAGDGVVVYDSEGPKRSDGTLIEEDSWT